MPPYLNFSDALIILQSLVLAVGSVASARAQNILSHTPPKFQIDEIIFEGSHSFNSDILKEIIQSKETASSFSQFLYNTFGEKLGSKPEYFDSQTFDEDKRLLKEYYQHNGFYNANITGEALIDSGENKAILYFYIQEKIRSYIDSITYVGLDTLPVDVRRLVFEEPMIQIGMPYLDYRASAEIARVLVVLADHGYPAAQFDDIHSQAVKKESSQNFVLTLAFIPGKQYKFGEVTIHGDPSREDITADLSLRHLDFQSGEIYSRKKRLSSERNLNRLDLFETARIEHPPITDTSSTSVVPIEIYERPRHRNELSPEIIVSDENNYFNLGLGIGYINRNFFGDARSFTVRTRVRTQSIQEWNFKQAFGKDGLRDTTVIGAIELQFQILQPYFFTRTLSGSWMSSLRAEKQKFFILSIFQNKVGLSNQFAPYTYGFLDWTLERVSPELFPHSSTQVADSILSSLGESDQPQFNSIVTLTLQRDKTNDPFSPTEGFFNSISLEESGLLPLLIQGFKTGLPFTQYYKITLLGRWYKDLTSTRFNVFAMKLKTGYQDKYGESKSRDVTIPLNRRYFAGGSGSVRGWKARELGAMPKELIQFGGNFILEGNLELRVNHFRGFGRLGFIRMDNIWGVYFLDFGNSWGSIKDFNPKEIAIAAGFGFRYETFFGPFRIDYGFRIYDPSAPSERRSIFHKSFFGETLGSGVFHFGIGQAF